MEQVFVYDDTKEKLINLSDERGETIAEVIDNLMDFANELRPSRRKF